MEKRKEDLRTIRTRQHLNEAFTELLQKRNIDEINVGDICEKAMVHRTTFYKHFKDKFDLLDYNINDLKLHVMDKIVTENIANNPKQLYMNATNAVLDFVDTHENILLSAFKHDINGILVQAFFKTIRDALKELIEKHIDKTLFKTPVDITINYYSGAILSLCVWRMRNKKQYTKAQVLDYLDSLIGTN